MQYAIASEDYEDDRDDVYHLVEEGAQRTVCGLEPGEMSDKPYHDRRLCIRCRRSKRDKEL